AHDLGPASQMSQACRRPCEKDCTRGNESDRLRRLADRPAPGDGRLLRLAANGDASSVAHGGEPLRGGPALYAKAGRPATDLLRANGGLGRDARSLVRP